MGKKLIPPFHVDARPDPSQGRGHRHGDAGLSEGLVRWAAVCVSLGLEAAKKHLTELGAAFPDMPAFDESKYPPMPEVEINPRDEYYVEPDE